MRSNGLRILHGCTFLFCSFVFLVFFFFKFLPRMLLWIGAFRIQFLFLISMWFSHTIFCCFLICDHCMSFFLLCLSISLLVKRPSVGRILVVVQEASHLKASDANGKYSFCYMIWGWTKRRVSIFLAPAKKNFVRRQHQHIFWKIKLIIFSNKFTDLRR